MSKLSTSRPIVTRVIRISLACLALWLTASAEVSRAEPATPPSSGAEAAATATPKSANSVLSREEVTRRRQELSRRIDRLSRQTQDASSDAADTLRIDLEHLKQNDLLLLQHEAALEFLAEAREELVSWNKDLAELKASGLSDPPPYTVSTLDDTEDQVETETARRRAAASELATARQLLEAAQEEHDDLQRDRRRVVEESAEASTGAEAKAAALAQKEAELACSLAAERVALRRAELDVKIAREELSLARLAYYEQEAELLKGRVQFTDAELERRTKQIEGFAAELRERIKAIEARLETLPPDEKTLRQQFANEPVDDSVIEEAEEAWQITRRALHERIAMFSQRLAELRRMPDILGWRFSAAQNRYDAEELTERRDTIEEFIEQLEQAEAGLFRRVEELRLDLSGWQRRLHMLDDSDKALRPWIETKLHESQALAEDCEFCILQLKTAQRGGNRCLAEVERRLPDEPSVNVREQLREWWTSIWNYELAAVDDRPITIGKVSGALAYLIAGIFVARLVSRIAGRRLLPRVGMDRGASLAVQSITFYLLCAIGGFLALEFAHLPLTAFTFLGGAAAIGIGFGSQNILNNFISGLILLAEQPIRVGDVVELNNTYGTVEHIGMRSTRVRTGSNYELIVPNSKLLENNVVNLTLSDNSIRTRVTISFTHDSPISHVKRLLLLAAARHPQVLEDPAPNVLVTNFGSTTNEYELAFSLRIQNFGECREIESEIREAIDETYHEATRSLARPARDAAGARFDLRLVAPEDSRRAA